MRDPTHRILTDAARAELRRKLPRILAANPCTGRIHDDDAQKVAFVNAMYTETEPNGHAGSSFVAGGFVLPVERVAVGGKSPSGEEACGDVVACHGVSQDAPLIAGGQGRSDAEVREWAETLHTSCTMLMLGVVVAVVMFLAAIVAKGAA